MMQSIIQSIKFHRIRLRFHVSLMAIFLLAGISLRTYHYIINHTIWYDEAVLLVNIEEKSLGELVGKLDYEVAAPPLFVWSLKCVGLLVGDNPYFWRLLPFLASCGTLLLISWIGRRYLPPFAAIVLTGMVAFSDAFIWLGCNVKPYIVDAFMATCLLAGYLRTANWSIKHRLWLISVTAPVVLTLSYPAMFLYGALSVVFLRAVWREQTRENIIALSMAVFVVALTAAVLYLGPITAQRVSGLVNHWNNKFPDPQRPWTVPGWIVGNTLLVFHFCYNPIGVVAAIFAVIGCVWCVRRGLSDWAIIAVGPLILTLFAAFVKSYPYSGNRLILFAAPGLGFLIALGAAEVHTWLQQKISWSSAAILCLLTVPDLAYSAFHLWAPWPQPAAASVKSAVEAARMPNDLVASDEANYVYFFHGELKSLNEIAHSAYPAGQRLWVPMDYYESSTRREYITRFLKPQDWELIEAKEFYMAGLYLFQKIDR